MQRSAGFSNDCDHFAPSTWEERETAARFKSREGIQRIQSQWSDWEYKGYRASGLIGNMKDTEPVVWEWEYEGYRASGLRMGIRRIQSQWSENGNTKDTEPVIWDWEYKGYRASGLRLGRWGASKTKWSIMDVIKILATGLWRLHNESNYKETMHMHK